jgi:hypothetical protein
VLIAAVEGEADGLYGDGARRRELGGDERPDIDQSMGLGRLEWI